MPKLLALLLIALLLAGHGRSAVADQALTATAPNTAASTAPAVPDPAGPTPPMDGRVRLTLTIVGVAAAAALTVVIGPYVWQVLEIGSVSVLCTVSPVC